jgi:hypothetical protein
METHIHTYDEGSDPGSGQCGLCAESFEAGAHYSTDLPLVIFGDILALAMAADPSPLSASADVRIREWLDYEAQRRGYEDWVAAYHLSGPEPAVTKADGLYCCHLGCPHPATVEILTVRSTPHGPEIGGPDIYSDDTHACDTHIGALLGHQPDAANPDELYWEIRPLHLAGEEPA